MTEWALHDWDIGWRRPVRTAAVALLLLAVPALAQTHDTFAQFEARCLTPMIEVRESDTRGLTLLEDMAGRETWIAAGLDWHLTRAAPDAAVQYCGIIGDYTYDQSDAWAEAAVASGDYEVIETEPLRLHSTFLREPVIEVEFDLLVPSVTVIETNLES